MQIKGEGGSGLGWAEEGILPDWDPRPGPTPSRPSSSAPVPPTAPPAPTRASGPAALTARPWPERSKGLPNPPRATVGAAARDSLPDWGRGRPLVGGGGEGRGSPVEKSCPRRRRARLGGGAGRGGGAGPQRGLASGARPSLIPELESRDSEMGVSDPARNRGGWC